MVQKDIAKYLGASTLRKVFAKKYLDASILKRVFPPRPKSSHKGDFGYTMVLAGSEEYAGAAVLNAVAAQRGGTDAVFLVAPRRAADIGVAFSPSLIGIPLSGKQFLPRHVKKALQYSGRVDCVCVGSGMGKSAATCKALLEFMRRVCKPLVVDADAIRALEGLPLINKRTMVAGNVVTPHADEFWSLTGEKLGKSLKERMEKVKHWAQLLGCTILLKGAVDVISDGRRTALNKVHSPLMAVGGTGDLLAGLCAGILAQGNSPFDSACAAAYLNGLAGTIAAKGMRSGLKAEDLLKVYDDALKSAQLTWKE